MEATTGLTHEPVLDLWHPRAKHAIFTTVKFATELSGEDMPPKNIRGENILALNYINQTPRVSPCIFEQ